MVVANLFTPKILTPRPGVTSAKKNGPCSTALLREDAAHPYIWRIETLEFMSQSRPEPPA